MGNEREDFADPKESVADVGHGTLKERGFGAEAVVDANGEEAGGVEEADLFGTDVGPAVEAVTAPVD